MEKSIKKIRDLTFILIIYLYFIAWIYVHFYYRQFGISASSVKIDYESYLMYSYNVVTSAPFLFWAGALAGLFLLGLLIGALYTWRSKATTSFESRRRFLEKKTLVVRLRAIQRRYSFFVLLLFFIVIFPVLFSVARQAALADYKRDRIATKNLKAIQFIFRKDAEMMSPATVLDSALSVTDPFYSDISLLRKDTSQLLRLIGESDQYYIVLQQLPFDQEMNALPSGYVYYIDKKDVLLSKIILRSQ